MTDIDMPASYEAANGGGYLSADTLLANAPADIEERDVDVPRLGGRVRVRALTAAQAAKVQQAGFVVGNNGQVRVRIADAEITKVELALVSPQLDHNQVVRLFQAAGPSFAEIVKAIDEISGTSSEELAKARAIFPGQDEV